MTRFICLLFEFFVGVTAAAKSHYYMDQPTGCGLEVPVADNYIYVHARSDEVPADNPPVSCKLYLQTHSVDPRYKLEITLMTLAIKDCSIRLEIYNQNHAFGQPLKSLGCGSKSTDTMYSSGRFLTLKLTRPRVLYKGAFDFTMRIRSYDSDPHLGLPGCTRLCAGEIRNLRWSVSSQDGNLCRNLKAANLCIESSRCNPEVARNKTSELCYGKCHVCSGDARKKSALWLIGLLLAVNTFCLI